MARLSSAVAVLFVALLLVGAGIYAGHRWFPQVRVVQVAQEIIKAVPVPGETKVVQVPTPFFVPGIDRLIPVDVTRIVDRPGQDRIVTVTQPVNVPVEVVRREWPQTITVRVGSVLTKEYGWATPVNADLLIGQVTPGVYAVPVQEGWKVESVTTETKIPTGAAESRWHIEVRPGLGFASAGGNLSVGPVLMVDASRGHLAINGQVGYGITGGQFGAFGSIFAGWRF